jgi:phytoene desaturase
MTRAVIIGGGIGGLAAAIRLAAAGVAVTLVEARTQLGGRAGQLSLAGYTFDRGPTILTAPDLLRALWAAAGHCLEADLTLVPLQPYYQVCFPDGLRVDCGPWDPRCPADASGSTDGSPNGLPIAALLDRLPLSDQLGYRRFLADAARLYRQVFGELGRQPFLCWWDFVRIIPGLIRYRADRSVYGMVSAYVRDERLRVLLSFHPLFIGANPFRASALYGFIPILEQDQGVWFVQGGMYRLIAAMERLLGELSVVVRRGTPVTRILVEDGRAAGVQLADGSVLPAEVIISSADVAQTYQRLLPPAVSGRFARSLARLRPSPSCFLLYLGVDRRYPWLRPHTILMPHDYQRTVAALFRGDCRLDDLALYLYAPTRLDPGLAPPGGEVLMALVPVPNLDGRLSWPAAKDALRSGILRCLADRLGLVDLEQHIVVERAMTPLDFRDELRSDRGAAFAFEPTLRQSAYFRPHNRVPGLSGLYLVGAGTQPGAGIPGVLLSAEITARLVLADLGRGRRLGQEVQ